MSKHSDRTVAVVGLGYVGLPLALAFGRTAIKTIGFDINKQRVRDLKSGIDSSGELTAEEIQSSKLIYTDNEDDLKAADFFIVAVPTPINKANQPDLWLLDSASQIIGRQMQKGSVVVYESTVYPGVTEEFCGPILEKVSGLKQGHDFKLGYSPERINPGDKEHTLERIVKVVSGEDQKTTKIVADTYLAVCEAGVHIAPNIKTAEAAKVIENTQRDLNIALINELSLIFHRMGINTQDVLAAAGTKWNFLKFSPGLVGGHCIGVDPYYLVYKAQELGYHPEVIAAGRRVNDSMPEFVADETIKGLIGARKNIQSSKVLVIGLTFKEDVKDTRNSRIAVTIDRLRALGVTVKGYDPMLTKQEIRRGFDIDSIASLEGKFDAVIIASVHKAHPISLRDVLALMPKRPVVFDVKSHFSSLRTDPTVIYTTL